MHLFHAHRIRPFDKTPVRAVVLLTCTALTLTLLLALSSVANAKARCIGATTVKKTATGSKTVCVVAPGAAVRPKGKPQSVGGPDTTYALPTDGTVVTEGFDPREQAVQWALSMKGKQNFAWYSELFIENAFNTRGRFASAWAAAKYLGLRRGTAPRGALMFFKPDSANRKRGHVGISLGNGQMISALRTVKQTNVVARPYWRAAYAGWSWAPKTWPGRATIKPAPAPPITTTVTTPAPVVTVTTTVTGPTPAPTPTPTPENPKRIVVTVDNRYTAGLKMIEDTVPLRLTSQPWTRCGSRGCNINGTERFSNDTYDAAICQTQGDRYTNGNDADPSDDANPDLATSTLYYGIKLADGTFGYASEVWIAKSQRGGSGLPSC